MRRSANVLAIAIGTFLGASACTTTDSQSAVTPPTVSAPVVTTQVATTAITDTTAVDTTSVDATVVDTTVAAALDPNGVTLTPYIDGLHRPVDLAFRGDEDSMYVVEQGGTIVRITAGAVGQPVLDISNRVNDSGERGLLGLAFHPTEALAYVNYINNQGHTVIAEYSVMANGDFDTESARIVLAIVQPFANHNGGDLAFGPDGYLYIGMGDGGSRGDPDRRALATTTLLGKMLRIDPRATANGDLYTVPADNPFVGVDGARPEIWSIGLRNPWRFSFDSEIGDLWVADVGQGDWEEVNLVRAADGAGRGTNFGWSAFEGTHRYNDDQSPDGVTAPIYEYSHDDGSCSVSGGVVYRGDAITALRGWYLFGDYCTGNVLALQIAPDGGVSVLSLGYAGNLSGVAAGPDGELYALDHSGGRLLRVDAT